MQKHILKAYYGDIFFEFLLRDKASDAVFFLPGFPSSNKYDELMWYLHDRGFHVFTIRYRGSYQSKGEFLETDPVEDMLAFIQQIKKGTVVSLWDNKEFSFDIKRRILSASSYGGAVAAGTIAQTAYFNKAIFFAPVWDFAEHNMTYDEQDLAHLTQFTKRAFKNCYRLNCENIKMKIAEYPLMSKENYINDIDIPVLVFHGSKDKTVRIEHTKAICQQNQNIYLLEHSHGHGLKKELLEDYKPKVEAFLKHKV